MKFVSPLLKRVVYPTMSGAGLFRRSTSHGIAILTYHGVLPSEYNASDPVRRGNLISAETLNEQLRFIKCHYDLISPDDFLQWRRGRLHLPRRAVLLTCDDGLLNCLTDMLPVLKAEEAKALYFVLGTWEESPRRTLWYEELLLLLLHGPPGKFRVSCDDLAIEGILASQLARHALWWDTVKRLSQVTASARASLLAGLRSQFGSDDPFDLVNGGSAAQRRFGLLTSAEIQEIASAGMTIGAHTMNHLVLSQAPREIARTEIIESKRSLEALLQKQVWALAYPFGYHGSVKQDSVETSRGAGFEAAFLNYGGGLGAELPPYALPRIHVTDSMGLAELDAHLSGFHLRVRSFANRESSDLELARA